MSEDREVGTMDLVASPSMVGTLAKAELDQSITTAKAFPRSVQKFQQKVEALACLNESVAADCLYALPRYDSETREKKTITGPSARFGEILLSSYGNCIAGATIVDIGAEHVTARGVFHDLENNVKVFREVQRRITGKGGRRYSADMIAVTANAAASIAARNATHAGIPQALWAESFDKVLALVRGRAETFAARRDKAMQTLAALGITADRVLARLERAGVADITMDDLVVLRGSVRAMQDGEVAADEAFPPVVAPADPATPATPAKGVSGMVARAKAAKAAKAVEPPPLPDGQEQEQQQGAWPRCGVAGCEGESAVVWQGAHYCAAHVPSEMQG